MSATPFYEHQAKLRAQMAATPAGKLLAEIGFDYYDTETSARRVAEHAVKKLDELQKQNTSLWEYLDRNFPEVARVCREAPAVIKPESTP